MLYGRFDYEIRRLRQAVEDDPLDAKAWQDLGMTLLDAQAPSEALDALRRAFELAPNHARVANAVGDCYHDRGGAADAVVWYRKAVALDPRFGEAWLNLGVELMELAQFADALVALQQVPALLPEAGEAWLYQGLCLLRLHRAGEAKLALERAILAEPGEQQAYIALSDCHLQLGEVEGAAAACEKALRAGVRSREIEFLLTRLRAAGMTQAASDRMQRAAARGKRAALELGELPSTPGDRVPLLGGLILLTRALIIKHLGPSRWEVCERRFGLNGQPAATLQDIAAVHGKTREWTRQVEARVLHTLKVFLLSELEYDREVPASWRRALVTFLAQLRSAGGPVRRLTAVLAAAGEPHPSAPPAPHLAMLGLLGALLGWRTDPTLEECRASVDHAVVVVDPAFDFDGWLATERAVREALRQSVRPLDRFNLMTQVRQRLRQRFDPGMGDLVLTTGRSIETLADGRFQLAFTALGSMADRAYRILGENPGQPQTVAHLVATINHREAAAESERRADARSLASQLAADPRFAPIGRSGRWTLSEWQGICRDTLPHLIETLLLAKNQPVSLDEIRAQVLAKRPDLAPESVHMTLTLDDRFVRVVDGRFGLAIWGLPVAAPRGRGFEVAAHEDAIRARLRHIFAGGERLPLPQVIAALRAAFPMSDQTARKLIARSSLLATGKAGGGTTVVRFTDDPAVNGLGLARKQARMATMSEAAVAFLRRCDHQEARLSDLAEHLCRRFQASKPTAYAVIAKTPAIIKVTVDGVKVCRLLP